jgi:hypothetical protein
MSYQLALVIAFIFRERGSALSRHILIKSGTRPNTTLYFIFIPGKKFSSFPSYQLTLVIAFLFREKSSVFSRHTSFLFREGSSVPSRQTSFRW